MKAFVEIAVLTALSLHAVRAAATRPPAFPPKKYKVCSITVNSSEEIETFKEYLPEEHFEFMETVPIDAEANGKLPLRDDDWLSGEWFDRVCEQVSEAVYKRLDGPCDITVVSGLFGGRFAGDESRYSLSLRHLQQMACSRKCAWLLSAPQEVFLFSCNVLAEKEADSRNPEEYIQVLLDHDYSPLEAERSAAVRYSPLASSWKQRMRFIFASPEHNQRAFIYGFDSKAPYGRNIKHLLEDYFQTVEREEGGYLEHLAGLDESRFPNSVWSRALDITHQTQTLSAKFDDPEYETYQEFCGLYDKNRSDEENMELALSLLRRYDEGAGSAYFEHISLFISRRSKHFEGEAAELFEETQNDGALARHYADKYREEKDWLERFPLLQAERLRFLSLMKWISPEFYQSETKALVRSVIFSGADSVYGDLRILREMDPNILKNALLSVEDFSDEYFQNPHNLRLFGLWFPRDLEIQRKITGALDHEDPEVKKAAIFTLKDIVRQREKEYPELSSKPDFESVFDLKVQRKIADALEHEDPEVKKAAFFVLGDIKVSDPEIRQRMTGPLNDEDPKVRFSALIALSRLYPPVDDPRIQRKAADRLDDEDPEVRLQAFWALGMMSVSDPEIQSTVEGFLEYEDHEVKMAAARTLRYWESVLRARRLDANGGR